jgi:hypothetical protein
MPYGLSITMYAEHTRVEREGIFTPSLVSTDGECAVTHTGCAKSCDAHPLRSTIATINDFMDLTCGDAGQRKR